MDLEKIGLISSEGVRVPLQRVDVRLAMQDIVCETKVTQEFANKGEEPIEAVYTFPIPSDAVLLAFDLCLGDKTYRGHVIERKEAEANYEEAIDKGDAAFRLQSVGDGLYTMSVGNLKPGEAASIRFRYAQLLRWSGNRLSVRVPTTIAPRYGEASELEPWQRPGVSLLVDYPFSLSMSVSGALAKARFECPTHPVSIDIGESKVQIALATGAALDRDFVLNIESEAASPRALVARHGECSVALISLAPAVPDAREPAPRSVVIVVDCSGSMAGASIVQAKEALHQILQHLRPEDCFELLAFGNNTKPWASRCVSASRKNLGSALTFIEDLDANLGGTEIAKALRVAVNTKATLEPCDMLLITDGEVWLDDEFFTSLQNASRRIFAVGVGAAPAEGNLKRLAAVTAGAFEQVTPGEDMSARIARHFERLFQPRVSSAKVEWPTEPMWTADGQTHSLFAGDTAVFFAGFALPVAGSAEVRLEFQNAGEIVARVTLEPTETSSLSADTLVRLAACSRLGTCANTQDALKLALEHQLVTSNTDYLVVVERAEGERTKELPELQVVPQTLAAGWGGTGMVNYAVMCSQVSSSASDLEMLDIPSFSRGQVDDDVSVSQDAPHYGEIRFSRGAVYGEGGGVPTTPRSFVDALAKRSCRIFRPARLPSEFAQLEDLGLPNYLVDALKALQGKGYDEHMIVLALLAVLRDRLSTVMPKRLAAAIGKALQKRTIPNELAAIAMELVPNLSSDDWGMAESSSPSTARV